MGGSDGSETDEVDGYGMDDFETEDANPAVDDRLAPPETRIEYLDGVEMFAHPADEPHATIHLDLAYVLGAHVAPGFRVALDMLTRTDAASDFAPDASVYPLSPDPATGGRRIEALAFEIVSRQRLSVATTKARKLAARGVRRLFCIHVKRRRMLEWSQATSAWAPLPAAAEIDDPAFARPVPVRAILDATEADDAVAKALIAREVPALRALEARGEARGETRGRVRGARNALLVALRARGLPLPEATLARIEACEDLQRLDRWLEQVIQGANID